MDTYAHVLPGTQAVAAERFDQFMLPRITGIRDAVKPVGVSQAERVANMLPNALREYLKKRGFETEPRLLPGILLGTV